MYGLSAFAFEAITLWIFEKKLYEANASVKRNTLNTIKAANVVKTCSENARSKMKQKGGVLLEQDV